MQVWMQEASFVLTTLSKLKSENFSSIIINSFSDIILKTDDSCV